MFSVTISEKGGQQSKYDFSKPEITIGRMKGNDIVLPKGNVSKQHTRIFLRDDSFYIVDLKSTNGTYVNGRKVTSEQSIGESDKIYIGDFILQLERQRSAQQQGPPGGPPKPPGGPSPNQPSGGGSNNGRHFPTVMDGAERDSMGGGAAAPGQPSPSASSAPGIPSAGGGAGPTNPPQQGRPQRTSSAPGEQPGSGQSGGAPGGGMGRSPDPGSSQAGGAPGGGMGRGADAQSPGSQNNEDSGNDLRKTYGESAPELDLVSDIEPLDDNEGATAAAPKPESPPSGPPSPSTAGAPSANPPSPSPSPSAPATPATASPSSSAQPPTPDRNSGTPSRPQPGSTSLRETGPAQQSNRGADQTQRPSLDSEFDEEFHRAQQDVARVFFESMPIDKLSLDYPLDNKALERRVSNAVSKAVDTVNPNVDHDTLIDTVVKEAVGLGAAEDYLDDDTVRAIYVNAYDRIVVQRDGQQVVAQRAFSHPDMLDLAAKRLIGPADPMPVSEEVRFGDGTRVHIVMPPVSVEGPALTIQKPNNYFPTLEELADTATMSPEMAEFLERAVESGRSIVIAGPTNSGKSTLLAALTKAVPSATRIIAIEQHSNLPVENPNLIRLEASPSTGVDMRLLMGNAIAMHPDRILVDECHGAEAYDWVTAGTTGTEGSMLTLHGTSAVDALSRLQSMCLLAGSDISPRGLREQVARAVDLVVVVNGTPDSGFRVQQIAEVQGVDIDAFRLNDIFYYRVEGSSGDFHPTGYIPLFYEDLRHAGLDVDLGIFRE